jgi:hypothetical protein
VPISTRPTSSHHRSTADHSSRQSRSSPDILRNIAADRSVTATTTETETVQQLWDNADSLHHWAPIFDDLVATANASRYTEVVERVAGPAVAARLATDPALNRLAAGLAAAAAAGYDPDRVLAAVAGRRELHTAHSVALVLAYRIEQLTAATPSDLARPITVKPKPYSQQLSATTTSPDSADALRQVAELCDNRIRALAQQAAAEPPPWAGALGSPPIEAAQREQWLRRAAAVVAYRDHYQPTGNDPIGLEPNPNNPVRWTAWQHARIALRTGTLAGQATEASTRQLRAIVRRKHLHELDMPAYVAEQLRAAHLQLASARQRAREFQLATIAAARTSTTTWNTRPVAPDLLEALHNAAHDEQRAAQLVDSLEAQHSVWTQWYTDSFENRLAGTVATLELNRRNRPESTTGQPDDQLLDQLHAFEARIDGRPVEAHHIALRPPADQKDELSDDPMISPYDTTSDAMDGPDLTLG